MVSTELDLTGYALTLVDEGSEIRVGRHVFKVISTPGHTVGHMALYEERSGICFTGDHVLFVITPASRCVSARVTRSPPTSTA